MLTVRRNKLRRSDRSDRSERIFDAVRAVITETNVLANKTRRALDSMLLDDAVATQRVGERRGVDAKAGGLALLR